MSASRWITETGMGVDVGWGWPNPTPSEAAQPKLSGR